jgi:hypothetical protein
MLFRFGALLAQPVSKKGEFYLPEEGDIGLSVDATPILDYIGNFFSESENSAPSAEFANNNFAIMVKKFKDAETAYRASARINVLNESFRSFSPEFSQEPTNTTVEDKYSRTFTNAYLSLGIEKRKGSTRIQGFYGVEGIIGFGTESHDFDYGNDITPENTHPVRTEFEIQFQDDPREVTSINEDGAFLTQFKEGTTFSIGARAFIGAEIFLFPKWSLGFEYGFSAAFAYTGNSSITSEQFSIPTGGSTEQFVTTVDDEGGSSQLRIDNDNSGGAFFMSFYF